jgi:hypothetical protein
MENGGGVLGSPGHAQFTCAGQDSWTLEICCYLLLGDGMVGRGFLG